MVASIYLVLSLLGLLAAVNAVRPPLVDSPPTRRPPWLPVMLTTETTPLRLLWRGLLTAGAWQLGVLDSVIGQVALWITVTSSLLLLVALSRSLRSGGIIERALTAGGVEHSAKGAIEWFRAVAAYPYRVPGDVERIEVEYAPGLTVDIYRSRTHASSGPRPAIFQVHGGGWHGGNRRQSARPLLHRTARHGWIGVAADYPLTPAATWPEPAVALKLALAWLKTEGAGFGIDPDAIVVTGSSAGAHLAAHLALSSGDLSYQPGFEHLDLSVAGAVPFYGIFDLLNRNHTRDPWPFIGIELMKSSARTDETRWRSASPLDLVRHDAPPFLIIHGTHDSLVPARESAQFAAVLGAASAGRVIHIELPGATHGFDVVESFRTHHAIAGVISFVTAITRTETDTEPPAPGQTRSRPTARRASC